MIKLIVQALLLCGMNAFVLSASLPPVNVVSRAPVTRSKASAEFGSEQRPWWTLTLRRESIPWPLPTGDLAVIRYYDAAGHGIWDVPWVFIEQMIMVPSYLAYGAGETAYELLGGNDETHDPDQWQWGGVNGVLGGTFFILSSANQGVAWVVDTVGHDLPIALSKTPKWIWKHLCRVCYGEDESAQ